MSTSGDRGGETSDAMMTTGGLPPLSDAPGGGRHTSTAGSQLPLTGTYYNTLERERERWSLNSLQCKPNDEHLTCTMSITASYNCL